MLRYSQGEKYGPHYDSVQGEALKVNTRAVPCADSILPSASCMASTQMIGSDVLKSAAARGAFLNTFFAGPVPSHCNGHCVPQ